MNKSDVLAFARRDWRAFARMKADHWAKVKKNSGAAEAIRAGEELRKQTRILHPHWPNPQDRRKDLKTHARVAALLGRVVSLDHR